VIHGLSTEMLHSLLQRMKAARAGEGGESGFVPAGEGASADTPPLA
jgi:hypothetical protein